MPGTGWKVPYHPALAAAAPAAAAVYDAAHFDVPDAEDADVGLGPYKHSGAPPDGFNNGIAEKGASAVDIVTGAAYANTGTKAATVWTKQSATAPYWISGRIHQHYASGTTGSKVQITPLTEQVAHASAGWTASNDGDLIPPQAGLYTVDWAATIESNAGQTVKVFAEDSDTSTVNVDASAAWRVPDAQGDGTGVTWSSTWAGATPTDSIGLAIEMAALSGATSGDVDVYVVLRLRYVGPLA